MGEWVEPGPAWPSEVTGDESEQGTPVGRRQQGHLGGADVLVAGGDHLVRLGQVHPQLDPVEEAPADHQLLGRCLDVQDPAAGRHPLGVAVGDQPSTTDRVLMLEGAVDHVGDRLEAPVGVPRSPLGLARRVLDLTHLVHVDERVQVTSIDAGKGPAHRKALPLESGRGGRHREHRPRLRHGRIRDLDLLECKYVFHCDCRHPTPLSRSYYSGSVPLVLPGAGPRPRPPSPSPTLVAAATFRPARPVGRRGRTHLDARDHRTPGRHATNNAAQQVRLCSGKSQETARDPATRRNHAATRRRRG